MTTGSGYVTVARIVRARGNKGEVAAELFTDFPERLKTFREVFLSSGQGEPRRVGLKSFWVDRNHPGFAIFHFEGIASIGEAEKLRGLEVQIPIGERVTLPTGSYFVSDLIGCSVFEISPAEPVVASSSCSLAEAPALLGKVRDVYFPGEAQPGTPLLALDATSGEWLIPLAEDICKGVDIGGRRIEVVLPEGFRELNDE
jgi:16S rRNA processing protein RimM